MDTTIAFLFDMDGVIVDSNPAHKIALRQFCKKYGRDLSEEQLKEKIYGRTNKDWIPAVFGQIAPEELSRYADEKEALFREIYKSSIQPLPGLVPFLQKLQAAKIPTAIATSAPRANVDFTLAYTGTGEFFRTILDESFVSRGKPDPEIYLKTAAAIGFAPAKCIVLEDSLSGVKSGKAAGCKVVAITTTHSAEELHEADAITGDFIGLEPTELISRLFS
jgi:beta-phosphoglucomutase